MKQFLTFKFVNNPCNIWACFYMIIKPTFVPGKILIAIVTLLCNGMDNLVASIFFRIIRSVSKMKVIFKKNIAYVFHHLLVHKLCQSVHDFISLYLSWIFKISYPLNFWTTQAERSRCTLFLPFMPFLSHIEIYSKK